MAPPAVNGTLDHDFYRLTGRDLEGDLAASFAAPRPSRAERLAAGRSLRRNLPRSGHAEYRPRRRPDPVAIIEAQNATRIPHLVPVRMARMLASPFAFLRGAAAVMAADLARLPRTGLDVMACGDMHVSNFGLFGSAERNLVFAINDFDEVHPGPWEWDVKRLAASAAVAAAFLGGDKVAAESAARAVVEAYVRRVRRYSEMGFLEVWYDLIDANAILAAVPPQLKRSTRAVLDRARARGHVRTLDRLTERVDGRHRIIEDVPLIVRETHHGGTPAATALDAMLKAYVVSLPDDRRRLLSRFRIVDVVRKVVGVGSVGTGCWVLLLEGMDSREPLFLQVKEAQESVLAPHLGPTSVRHQGRRVVVGQRMIQGSPDIFLGWGPAEPKRGGRRHYYVRQLADMKGGIRFAADDRETRNGLDAYCRLCGWALALAHAKSGDAAMISGYCGTSDALPDAIGRFALAYHEQTERDHDALAAAARRGRIPVATETG